MSSLKTKFLYQLSATTINTVAPILTFPYISRVLGPENIGKINFIDYTTQFLLLFAAFGVPMYGMREIARNRTDKLAVNKIVSELLCIQVFSSLISLVLFAVLLLFTPHDFLNKSLLLLAVVNIAANALSLDWLIQGFEDFAFFTRRTFVARILMLAAIFLFIKTPQDYARYYFIFVSGSFLLIGFGLSYAYKKGIRFTTNIRPARHISALFLFFLTTTTISIYTFFDTFLLGLISGTIAVGFFTTALKSVKLSQHFINGLSGVMMPRMSYLYTSNDTASIRNIHFKALHYVLTIAIPLAFGFYLLAPEFMLLIAGPKYLSAVSPLRILSVLPVIVGLSNVFGFQMLLPMGKERKILLAVSTGSLVSIVLCGILCQHLKHNGAAIACISAELAVTCIMGYFALQYQALALSKKMLTGILCSTLFFIPIVFLFRHLFYTNTLLVFLLSTTTCLGIFFILQYWVFKNSILIEITHFLLQPFHKLKAHVKTTVAYKK